MPHVEHTPPCPRCSREPGPNLILLGWQPCYCGGHRTVRCREETGGCGVMTYYPPLGEGNCEQEPED